MGILEISLLVFIVIVVVVTGIGFYIQNKKDLYEYLLERKDIIEQELNESGNWWVARKASGVRIKRTVSDVFDQTKAEEYFKWLYEQTIKSQKVFSKYIRDFKK